MPLKNEAFKLVKELQKQHATLMLAESVTGGLMAHELASIKGVSDVFYGSIVCYAECIKTDFLNVSPRLIQKYTAESQMVTDQLALHLKKLSSSDICAAVTGLASGGGTETKNKPVGTIFFSVVYRNKLNRRKKNFRGSPLEIRKKACNEMFKMIRQLVKKQFDSLQRRKSGIKPA